MTARRLALLTGLAVAILVAAPLLWPRSSDADFTGVDARAVEEAARIDPDHEPWATPLWSPPGTETESLLFALQAAMGAGVIGYVAGSLRVRRRLRTSGADTAPEA